MCEDLDIDDILTHHSKKKKKIDSSGKGKRGEGNLIKVLEQRFPGKPFSRTLGSGNRWSQARLTETAKKVFTGDIVCPENFLFALEAKNGYNEINLDRAIARLAKGKRGNKKLEEFLEQSEKDGNKVGKRPMMCWKRHYKPWIAFLKTEHLTDKLKISEGIPYKEWTILPLEIVLEESDEFFFN